MRRSDNNVHDGDDNSKHINTHTHTQNIRKREGEKKLCSLTKLVLLTMISITKINKPRIRYRSHFISIKEILIQSIPTA